MEGRVDAALRAVNIEPPEIEGKYPFELSGGQMQRMLLARIFILRPKVLIADEPTSMVDACVRANILDYLMKLKEELKMTIVFITHDIGLAYYVSDRLFIMHDGKILQDTMMRQNISKEVSCCVSLCDACVVAFCASLSSLFFSSLLCGVTITLHNGVTVTLRNVTPSFAPLSSTGFSSFLVVPSIS